MEERSVESRDRPVCWRAPDLGFCTVAAVEARRTGVVEHLSQITKYLLDSVRHVQGVAALHLCLSLVVDIITSPFGDPFLIDICGFNQTRTTKTNGAVTSSYDENQL